MQEEGQTPLPEDWEILITSAILPLTPEFNDFNGTVRMCVTYLPFRRVPVFRNFHPPVRLPGRVLAAAVCVLTVAAMATSARAEQDVVQFGNSIEVGPNQAIHDAVCFFCSVTVKGGVNGDIVVFFGNVNIEGKANHDVVNFFGDVRAADDTSIGHDLVNFFGGVRLGKNVNVGQDTVVMFGDLRADNSASIEGSRVVEPGWIFWGPLLAIILGIYFVVHELRNARRRRYLRGY